MMSDVDYHLDSLVQAYQNAVKRDNGMEAFASSMEHSAAHERWAQVAKSATVNLVLERVFSILTKLPVGRSLSPAAAFVVVLSAVPERSAVDPQLFASFFEDCVVAQMQTSVFRGIAYLLGALRTATITYAALMSKPLTYRRCFRTLSQLKSNLSSSGQQLTPAHPLLLLVAMENSHPTLVEGCGLAADAVITDVDPTVTGCTLADFILYYYYEAILHVEAGRYRSALLALQSAMSIPGYGSRDAILLNSVYPLFILTRLILTGKSAISDLEDINKTLDRSARAHCRTYIEFAEVYETLDATAIKQFAESKRQTWTNDKMNDVVEKCLEMVPLHRLRSWTRVCSACTLSDVATEVLPGVPLATSEPAIRKMLLTLVAAGELRCTLSSSDPPGKVVVHFHNVCSKTTTEATDKPPLARLMAPLLSPKVAAHAAAKERHHLLQQAVATCDAIQLMASRAQLSSTMLKSLNASEVAVKYEEWSQRHSRSLASMLGVKPYN